MALRQKYSDYDCGMMDLAGAALVEANHTNDRAGALAIYKATPHKFRADLRDFAIWLVEVEAHLRKSETLH